MKIVSSLLCEAATVRDGLINILSGGATSVARPNYPNVLGLQLALVLQPQESDIGQPFHLKITFVDSVSDTVLTAINLSGQPLPSPEFPGRMGLSPVVVPLPFFVPNEGDYAVKLQIDEGAEIILFVSATLLKQSVPSVVDKSKPPARVKKSQKQPLKKVTAKRPVAKSRPK